MLWFLILRVVSGSKLDLVYVYTYRSKGHEYVLIKKFINYKIKQTNFCKIINKIISNLVK